MDFSLNLPLNSTSFGNIGFSIAREVYRRNLAPPIFAIANQVDFGTQNSDNDFSNWLQVCANKSYKIHNRKNPSIKLWHCNTDSLSSLSNDEVFLTFIETNQITEIEKNILSQKKTVFVTSNFLKEVCENAGLTNVKYVQLGFDSFNFKQLNKKYWDDGRIVFNLVGKFEECRKRHKKVIQAWLKKFGCPKTGQKPKYFLQCALFNPFLVQNVNGQAVDHNQRLYAESLDGKEYSNIQFLNWMNHNSLYNDFLQSGNIIIGMGGGENFGAGEFHSVGLGRHAVILNANGFKDWANEDNACLVQPNGMIDANDGIFFHKGGPMQQGQFFDWDENEFIAACEQAIKRVENNPINVKGLELQKRNYKETVDTLFNEL